MSKSKHPILNERSRFTILDYIVPLVIFKDGRCTEEDDTLPDGFKLKKGDGVYYISYAMGRMPCIWGDDAEDYRPERWLNNGIFQPESPFKFIAFHVCKNLIQAHKIAIDYSILK